MSRGRGQSQSSRRVALRVEIDEQRSRSRTSETGGERDCRRSFAHSAFLIGYANCASQLRFLSLVSYWDNASEVAFRPGARHEPPDYSEYFEFIERQFGKILLTERRRGFTMQRTSLGLAATVEPSFAVHKCRKYETNEQIIFKIESRTQMSCLFWSGAGGGHLD